MCLVEGKSLMYVTVSQAVRQSVSQSVSQSHKQASSLVLQLFFVKVDPENQFYLQLVLGSYSYFVINCCGEVLGSIFYNMF